MVIADWRWPVDINNWQLEYEGEVFNFGTFDPSDDVDGIFPLKVQVDISDNERDLQDYPQPSLDGTVMGFERLGGFTLTFECTVVPEADPDPDEPWVRPLEAYNRFKQIWRADPVRRIPGKYATLRNLARNREVYGRPRRCAPTLDRIRKGGADWIADFVTNDPNWYQTGQSSVLLSSVLTEYEFSHLGSTKTWPVIIMYGVSGPAEARLGRLHLEKFSDGEWRSLWSVANNTSFTHLEVKEPPEVPPDNLIIRTDGFTNDASGPYVPVDPDVMERVPLLVDTRPWTRGVLTQDPTTGERDPEQGLVRETGEPIPILENMFIPNSANLRWRLSTDNIAAKIYWRDAFVSL
jgi:hypothetical protein